VLRALARCRPPHDFDISVIMGLHAPWLQDVKTLAAQMPWPAEVVLNAGNMAQRMADSDLAIGAAGSTSWERCCLGLPALMIVLAENQRDIAINLERVGAAILLDQSDEVQFAAVLENALVRLMESDLALSNLCHAASLVADGRGAGRVVAHMLKGSAT
jgi:UDP-2,4-diacetamido-2,4,6-trideoxy-beta-L-altropyranose hydrolase